MPISFNSVPSNLRVPFMAVEFDSTQAQGGSPILSYKALLLGQKLAAGSATADVPVRVTNVADAITLFGQGSMLHRMVAAWLNANRFTEMWVVPVADNGAGTAAAGDIDFAGPASAAGTISLYLGGDLVEVAVSSGDAASAIATAVAAAINADADLPVTAAVNGGDNTQVDITFRHKGTVGNGFDIRLNYADGEALPAGVTAVITDMANGATNPTLTNALAALGDEWYHVWAFPWTDSTSLSAIEAELADRFGPERMIDGVAFTAADGSTSTLATLGDARNSPHVSIMAVNESPTPLYEVAAVTAAVAAKYGADDPARPFQTLELLGVKAPAQADRFTISERNLLLFDGISVSKVDSGGVVRVERLITTYKENAAGADDTAYLDVTTMLTLMYLRYSFRTRILTRYPRHKLANDGTRYGAGQAVITPKVGKAEAIAWFRDMEELGLVENFANFKDALVVERDEEDPNRMNWLLPPDLVNQFVVGGAVVQFRLQAE